MSTIARRALKSDASGLDRLLSPGSISVSRDVVVVAGNPLYGALVWRPCAFVHELILGQGLNRRNISRSLVNFAIGDATARAFVMQEAKFLVARDNKAMLDYMAELGAVKEEDGIIYSLDL